MRLHIVRLLASQCRVFQRSFTCIADMLKLLLKRSVCVDEVERLCLGGGILDVLARQLTNVLRILSFVPSLEVEVILEQCYFALKVS